MNNGTRTAAQRDRDAEVIGELYCAGKSIGAIAEHLNSIRDYKLGPGAITRDLNRIRDAWMVRATAFISQQKADELAKLDHLERKAWAAFERSQRDRVRKHGERRSVKGEVTEVVGTDTEGSDGDPRWLAVVFQCIAKRIDVIGLAPNKVQLTGANGGPIQIQQTPYDKLPDATIIELNRVLRERGVFGTAPGSDDDGCDGLAPAGGGAVAN